MQEFIQDTYRVFVVPVAVLEDSGLSAQEKLVYVVLRSFCSAHKSEVFPSHATICRLSSLSKSTVIRVLKSLQEKGYIIKKHNYKYDTERKTARQTSNIYKLDVPKQKVMHRGVTETRGGVSQRHGGGVTETHEHNHLTNPEGNMNECMGSSDELLKPEILETLKDGVTDPTNPAYSDVRYKQFCNVLIKHFYPHRINVDVLKLSLELLAKEEHRIHKTKGTLRNPAGLFKFCYEDAIKLYKNGSRAFSY